MSDLSEYLSKAARAAGYDIDSPRGGGRKALAEATGMSQSSVGRTLSGDTVPNARILPVLADVLGVPRNEVLAMAGVDVEQQATAAEADFFQPRHTYTVRGFAYQCEHTTHHPAKGEREAWGWLHRGGVIWRLERLYDADYTADVAQSGEASRG